MRAVAYLMLLRDEYPPFGDGAYPAELVLPEPPGERDRLTVFFQLLLEIPHLIILALPFVVWAFTTAIAWVMILLTGSFPETLYGFALGVLAWTTGFEPTCCCWSTSTRRSACGYRSIADARLRN